MDQQQNKVKQFLKLGYSQSDILRVLQSLQHDAQTNDILEELIKTCRTTAGGHTVAERALSGSPQLVPRGCPPAWQPAPTETHSQQHTHSDSPFRPVVIDGSNVAISHGSKQVFSCRGIQLAVQWFWDRGIRDITVFVPLWRKEQSRPEAPITDQHILGELERKNILVYTPSRCVNGKRVVCYDDRYIVKLAYDSDGIIVSNDNYRDLQQEKPQWKKFIEERLLMYTFANDMFMPPDDPLGRNGPTIENFLRKKPIGSEHKQLHCPYGKKCTYGVKCKFYHPERGSQPQLSVADELRAKSQPSAEREEVSRSPQLRTDRFNVNIPNYLRSANGPSTRLDDSPSASLSGLDLYNDSQWPARSPAYLQRSLPALCKSANSDLAYGSLENSLQRLYLSDSALQNSLTCSSGCVTGSSSFLSAGSCRDHKRARSPDLRSCNYGAENYSPSQRSLQYSHHSYRPHSPLCEPCPYPGSLARQTSHPRLPEINWGSGPGQGQGAEQMTDRKRRDVRSQLSTIFPQSIVDQVMSLFPHTLDTTELVTLIQKYRNSHL